MNIVLVGASMIGRAVTGQLLKEKHDLVVIEKDPVKANRLSDNFDVLVINGSGTDLEVLKEAKVYELLYLFNSRVACYYL